MVIEAEQAAFLNALDENRNLLQAIEGLQGSIAEDTLSKTLSLVFETQLLKCS
jgi:hypothetical protein